MPKIMPMITEQGRWMPCVRPGCTRVGGAPGLFLKIVPPNSKLLGVPLLAARWQGAERWASGGLFDVPLKDARDKALALRCRCAGRRRPHRGQEGRGAIGAPSR